MSKSKGLGLVLLLLCPTVFAIEANHVQVSTELLAWLAIAAVAASFVDTIAGGGGLITIPVLMLTPLSVVQALATNKLQGSFGCGTASAMMFIKGKLSLRASWPGFALAFLGSLIGAYALIWFDQQYPDSDALDILVPIVVGTIALYFLLSPTAGDVESKPRLKVWAYRTFVVPIIGFYDGFFGPGTGSFFSMSEVALRGRNLLYATANAKFLNFATNLAAVVIFIPTGQVAWAIAGVMIFGQLIGAYLGSHVVVKGGSRWIRPVIVIVCFAMLTRYFYQFFQV